MNYSALLLLWFTFVLAINVLTTATRILFATSKLPPGPFPLPIVGNLFKLGNNAHQSLAKLAKIYGPLMTLKFGSVTTIVVSSDKMAQLLLQKHDDAFAGRTVSATVHILGHHEASLVLSQPTPYWRSIRKLCVSQMFTTQRLNSNEQLRLLKVKGLINYIRDNAKSRCAVDIGQAVFSTTLSIISCNVFSIDLTQLESSQDFKDIVCRVMEESGRPNLADFFPLLKPFDPQGIKKRMANYFRKLDVIFDRIIDQRLQSKEENLSNDVLDTLLHHTLEDGSILPHSNIKAILKDLFVAGTDTTTVTLEWAMTELLRNPNIMAKARLELKQTIDKGKPIEESDIAQLPYLQAIVKETMRLHPAVPLLIPHRAETDTDICSFTVPRHAQNSEDINMEENLGLALQKAEPLRAIPIEG
ncbi:Cytochrome p450 [Thalictrum thalictroides]|uniref:Cytochrome p450 n=1 Tax=Thalictrum thalictroides TaxID=46969 RepID=A0A7J6WY97_THATH|nr:Cytochrome p450 [Thalictrum thalictroides]